MFITTEGCAPIHHPSRVANKLRRHEVVTQVLEAPWYLVVYDVTCGKGRRVSQTSLVGCDEALVDLLDTMNMTDIRSIARLDRCNCAGPSWNLRWIDAVWMPGPSEKRVVGPLLLRFDAEPMTRDALLRLVGAMAGRRLLYEAGGFAGPGHQDPLREAG